MMGHIVLGSELLNEKIKELRRDGAEFPDKLEWMLKHMILSHHGSLEFGSPVVPLFPEAFVLYMMDNLDAKLFVYKEKIAENTQQNELFTSYDNFFGQYFFTYRLPHTENEESDEF
jgi:3'-5' exoribonuclease